MLLLMFLFYIVKIVDFGFVCEMYLKFFYIMYVFIRWYCVLEVLLRVGEYLVLVDIWVVGVMVVEVVIFKFFFFGGNEVDQVWRVCEIMGSLGNWYNKVGVCVGGGEWREGICFVGKFGFFFFKMVFYFMDIILQIF